MIYFTSDLHFGHQNILVYDARPFVSHEEMNQALVDNWNATVTDADTIYCVGDFSLSWAFAEEFSPKLRGKKILIVGNHDLCHPWNKRGKKKGINNQSYLDLGWSEVKDNDVLEYQGQSIILNHHPYDDKNGRPDEGKLLFHGHVHTAWKTKRSSLGTPMINVGCCCWDYRPVSIDRLMKTEV